MVVSKYSNGEFHSSTLNSKFILNFEKQTTAF